MTKNEAGRIKPAVICYAPGDKCIACLHYYGKAEFCMYKADADDKRNLRGFVREIMENWPLGDIEGGELQDLAIKYGLIKLKDPPPDKPCGEECTCADDYDQKEFADGKVECYERTELLRGL